MQRCQNCGTESLDNAQFCANCGHSLSTTTDMQTYLSSFPAQGPYNAPALLGEQSRTPVTEPWRGYQDVTPAPLGSMGQQPAAPGKDEEEERRRRLLLGLPLLGAMGADVQSSSGAMPMVHGTPSMGGVPMGQGTPWMSGAPSAQGASSTPFNPPSGHGFYNATTAAQSQVAPQPPVSQSGSMPPVTQYEAFPQTAPPPPVHHPVPPFKPVPKPGLGSIPIWVVIPVVVVIIIGGILGTIFLILPPSLSLSGNVISGGMLYVHGGNFFPGGTVVLTLDDGQVLTPVSSNGPVTVGGTGTFDATIAGTENWSLGQHTIHATESSGSRNGALNFTLNPNHTKVVPNLTSFSSPGDAHCAYHGSQGWTCQAAISTSPQALGNLAWSASSSGLSGITITPTSGSLVPGQTQQVTMAIPNTVCPASAAFTFTFKGGEDPVAMPWNCAVPKISWAAVSCPLSGGYYVCPFTLVAAANSEGLVKWTASGNSPGILINPQSGTLSPGQSQPVSVAFPANRCVNTSWTVTDSGGNAITGELTCPTQG